MNIQRKKRCSRLTTFADPLIIVLLLATGLHGAQPLLKVGDTAPTLSVSRWVQGDPVNQFERGKVYIVEFWATWCGPCVVSIPHLNALQNKFKEKGLVVIGQNIWEQDQTLVPPFINKMGAQMTYRVALDTIPEGHRGKTAELWMDAAGEDGIPTAFVVNQQGRIAWIGDPTELKESLLEEIVGGRFDLKEAERKDKERRTKDEQIRTLESAFRKHRQKEQWNQAEAALAQIETLIPESGRERVRLAEFGLRLDRKDYQAAYKLAEQLCESHPNDPHMLNQIAWDIATREDIEERNLDLAEKIVRRANDVTSANDPEIVDTLARVLFLKGQQQAAVELEQKAVELAEERRKETFQKILHAYQAGELPISQQLRARWHKFNQHRKNREWEQAETVLGEIATLLPEGESTTVERRRLEIFLERKDYPNANRLTTQLISAHKNEPMILNEIAWEIATKESIDQPALDLAERIARQADDACKEPNAEIVDTIARVLFLKGQEKAAVKLQEEAVRLAQGRRKEQFQQTLDNYKQGKLPQPY